MFSWWAKDDNIRRRKETRGQTKSVQNKNIGTNDAGTLYRADRRKFIKRETKRYMAVSRVDGVQALRE